MKCIKSIKSRKNVELGAIKRVDEKEAESEVKSGYWKYIPKSEYKLSTRKQKNVEQEVNKESSEDVKKPNSKKSKNDKKNS
jgi:hypothetical protein